MKEKWRGDVSRLAIFMVYFGHLLPMVTKIYQFLSYKLPPNYFPVTINFIILSLLPTFITTHRSLAYNHHNTTRSVSVINITPSKNNTCASRLTVTSTTAVIYITMSH